MKLPVLVIVFLISFVASCARYNDTWSGITRGVTPIINPGATP